MSTIVETEEDGVRKVWIDGFPCEVIPVPENSIVPLAGELLAFPDGGEILIPQYGMPTITRE